MWYDILGIWDREETAAEDGCISRRYYEKLQLSKHSQEEQWFSYYYDTELWWDIDPILLELDLTLDSRKTMNIGKTTHILDNIAFIGGFAGFVFFVMAFFGQYFASIFFIEAVSKEMY